VNTVYPYFVRTRKVKTRRAWIAYDWAELSAVGCKLRAGLACDFNGEMRLLRQPLEWSLKMSTLPQGSSWEPDASGVAGIRGGVADARAFAVSEALERSIGDAITLLFCEVLDQLQESSAEIYILGPALPKVVGRLAALRPPRSVQLFWLTPQVDSNQPVSLFALSATVVPKYPLKQGNEPLQESWQDEPLVIGCNLKTHLGTFTVQRMQMWGESITSGTPASTLLDGISFIEWDQNREGLRAPRDLLLASATTRKESPLFTKKDFEKPEPMKDYQLQKSLPVAATPKKRGEGRYLPYSWEPNEQ